MAQLDRPVSASSSRSASRVAVSPPSPTLPTPAANGSRALRNTVTEPSVRTQKQQAAFPSTSSSRSRSHSNAEADSTHSQLVAHGLPPPPLASEHEQQAYTSLHPQGSTRKAPQKNSGNKATSAATNTFTAVKNKLRAPSTAKKSKSEIPHSLAQVSSDLSLQKGLAPHAQSDSSNGVANTLMQRGPDRDHSADNDGDEAEVLRDENPTREDVKSKIIDQQQRIQELDQAQTEGLLRTQQEAGIEPPLEGPSHSHMPKMVGLPRFKKEKADQNTILTDSQQRSGTWTSKLLTKIPIKEFPLQGSGQESEFNQECPLWAQQPWKYAYFAWFGISVGFVYLPWWSLTSIPRSGRGRESWSWKRATMVKLYRHGTRLTFRTRTSLGRDLHKEVPHNKTVRSKFRWVDPVTEKDIKGELRRAMKIQQIQAVRTCGFWYGETVTRSRKSIPTRTRQNKDHAPEEHYTGVGRPAEPGEKVLLHLHGGAYWIGTAHEKDVTSAVNTETLRYMNEIYQRREQEAPAFTEKAKSHSTKNTATATISNVPASPSYSSPSPPPMSSGAYSATASGKLSRTFSLDYRLCVPGRPRAGSYPAALLDALSAYLYLVRKLKFAPENIIIAGDSSGGNLAVALCRYLRDEKVEAMPGSLLLMSPWVDVSRSHSGPTGVPNRESSVYTNQKSDIISPSLDFRNTAVSAFLGDLPARDAYRNPYISPASLQLPIEYGGSAPNWGFEGFPRRIYISTGSAEISYDQHLTIAHRMAEGTSRGKPVYVGDKLSQHANARHLAERRDAPRPKNLLCPEGLSMNPTPADELAHFQFGMSRNEAVDVVIDGEPRNLQREAPGASNKPKREDHERVVWLDEVKDAVHDYLLFDWFEPERSNTWRRIAEWIDEDDNSAVTSSTS